MYENSGGKLNRALVRKENSNYLTFVVESAPSISSSTSFWYQFLHLGLTYSFTHHFLLFWFTTLFVH